jgi:hypothetical protein
MEPAESLPATLVKKVPDLEAILHLQAEEKRRKEAEAAIYMRSLRTEWNRQIELIASEFHALCSATESRNEKEMLRALESATHPATIEYFHEMLKRHPAEAALFRRALSNSPPDTRLGKYLMAKIMGYQEPPPPRLPAKIPLPARKCPANVIQLPRARQPQ